MKEVNFPGSGLLVQPGFPTKSRSVTWAEVGLFSLPSMHGFRLFGGAMIRIEGFSFVVFSVAGFPGWIVVDPALEAIEVIGR